MLQCGIEHDGTASSTGRLTSVSSKSVQRSDPQAHVCVKSLFVEFEANNCVAFTVYRLGLHEILHMVDVLTITPVWLWPRSTSMHTGKSLSLSLFHGPPTNHGSCWVRCHLGWHPYVSGVDWYCFFRLGSAHTHLHTFSLGRCLMWSGLGVFVCLQVLHANFIQVHDTDGQTRSQVVFDGIRSDVVAQVRCWLGYVSRDRLTNLQNCPFLAYAPLIVVFCSSHESDASFWMSNLLMDLTYSKYINANTKSLHLTQFLCALTP